MTTLTTDPPPPTVDFPLAAACRSFANLGGRSLYELAVEVEREYPDAGTFFRQRLLVYGRLRVEDLNRAGGDRFPPPPLYILQL